MDQTPTTKTPEIDSLKPLIYVVDDEPMVGHVVEMCLKSAGYEVLLFEDPTKACQALESSERKPSLLLADYQMPGMNGMELIHRCKSSHGDLKTISISGTLHVDEIETFPTKPDRFIRKPFFPRELLEPVRELLAEQKTART